MKITGRKFRLYNNSGFSLIELVIILIVVSILGAMSMQSMTAVMTDAKQIKTGQEMNMLANAIVGNPDITTGSKRSDFGYVGDIGAFPPDIDALKSNPASYATWDGPYITSGFTEDSDGYKTDEWGSAYNYSGGLTVTSTGSGSTISKKIANTSSDYLLNSFNGRIKDAVDSLPGAIYKDSVDIKITIPNGAGGTTTKLYHTDNSGYFTFDSLPVGQHPLRIIYTPDVDTLFSYLTILPRNKSSKTYKFTSAYFTGGGGGSGVETLYPDGIGTSSDLTASGCASNWECVDEAISDGDATYVVGSGNSFNTDLYSVSDNSAGSGTIDSLKIYITCNSGGGGSKGKIVIRTGGTNYESGEFLLSVISSYTEFSIVYVDNPNTSFDWTWPEIDNLEIGVSIRNAAPCTQVKVEVYYTY